MPVILRKNVAEINQCHAKKPDHHHPFATKTIHQRAGNHGGNKARDRIKGHQAGHGCQREQQFIGGINREKRPNHGCAGAGNDQTEEHQPKLDGITTKNGSELMHAYSWGGWIGNGASQVKPMGTRRVA